MKEEISKVVEENKNLIYKIASNYKSNYDIEDLFQVGVIGLIKAYKKYIRGSPTKFSSYAYFYIFGEIIKYIKNDRNIRPSSEHFKIYKIYLNTREKLVQAYKKEPSLGEISLFMEIEENELSNIINSVEFTISLDEITKENISLDSFVGDHKKENIEQKLMLKDSINNLKEIERKIIDLRYYYDYSQSETAKILGISQAQVSRKEDSALKLIKRDIA